jgi:hypothetical protein
LHDSPRDHEPLEKESDKIKESIKEFNAKISRQFKKEQEDLGHDGAKPNPEDWSEHLQHNPDFREEFDNTINDAKVPEAEDDFTPEVFGDTCSNVELAILRDHDGHEFAKVTKRLRDKDGLPIGKADKNPILETTVCDAEHPDGHKTSLAANAIAENMIAQVDDYEGNRHILFDEITDHRTDGTEVKEQQDAFIAARTGSKQRRDMRSSSNNGRMERLHPGSHLCIGGFNEMILSSL